MVTLWVWLCLVRGRVEMGWFITRDRGGAENLARQGCKVTLIKPLCSPEISALIDCKKNMLTQRKTADKRNGLGSYFLAGRVSLVYLLNKESPSSQIGRHESVCGVVQCHLKSVFWSCHSGLPLLSGLPSRECEKKKKMLLLTSIQ